MTVLDLEREYYGNHTTGYLSIDGVFLAYTLELPWLDNQVNISCIPEGWYPLSLRNSRRFGSHILVEDVPGRKGILFHPANNALKELRGCVAPVMKVLGQGVGHYSRLALDLIIYNLGLQDKDGLFLRVHERPG
jgi:hypothetical protein